MYRWSSAHMISPNTDFTPMRFLFRDKKIHIYIFSLISFFTYKVFLKAIKKKTLQNVWLSNFLTSDYLMKYKYILQLIRLISISVIPCSSTSFLCLCIWFQSPQTVWFCLVTWLISGPKMCVKQSRNLCIRLISSQFQNNCSWLGPEKKKFSNPLKGTSGLTLSLVTHWLWRCCIHSEGLLTHTYISLGFRP